MDYSSFKSTLSTSKNIVITAHKSPDGDAIGSSLGLALVLRKQGFNVDTMVPDDFPAFLAWMHGVEDLLIFDKSRDECEKKLASADIIFSLDYNKLDRVGDVGSAIEKSDAVKVMIDHHIDPSPDYDFILSDTSASSTAELVFRFLEHLGLADQIAKPEAECLYAGIMTDTGSFRFSSTSANTHRVVAGLIDRGLQPDHVHQSIFDTNSFSRLKLMGYALGKKLEYLPELSVAIISLSLQEKNRFGYKKGDTEGLVNYGLSIQGVQVAVFLSEESGFVKFSFRSKGEVNVNEIAREHFNGGGHKNAAGGKIDGDLAAAMEQLKRILNEKFS